MVSDGLGALAPHPGARGYLNTSSIGLPPAATTSALRAALVEWESGKAEAPGYDAAIEGSRGAFARLVGVDPGDVAVGTTVSPFVALIAGSLPAGAEVVCAEEDFTSVLFPLLARTELRVRPVPLAGIAEAIGPATRLIAVSAVQSADGRVADLEAIAAAARDHDALTFVDATQACGWLPLDAGSFDFVAAGAYKWLLAPRGSAFLTVRRERLDDVVPALAGWFAGAERWGATLYGPPLRLAEDARRLDVSPAWLSWVGTQPALEYVLALGVERIHAHDIALADRFRAGLDLPPGNSAIVATRVEGALGALRRAGIRAAARAGALRVAFHLYNDAEDVDRALAALGR